MLAADSFRLIHRSPLIAYADMLLCSLRLLRDFDEFAKRRGIAHREVCEHLAVDRHTCGGEAADELVVRHAVLARGSVDPGDPEGAELPLAVLAVPRGVLHRL